MMGGEYIMAGFYKSLAFKKCVMIIGTYTGEYTFETLYAKVSVIVKDEEIKKITLDEFETEKGDEAAKIVDSIVEKQSVTVDDVTKATDSSRVIKLAVLNALGQ